MIILPSCNNSGNKTRSKNFSGLAPKASEISKNNTGRHLFPPLSKKSQIGSDIALLAASTLYS